MPEPCGRPCSSQIVEVHDLGGGERAVVEAHVVDAAVQDSRLACRIQRHAAANAPTGLERKWPFDRFQLAHLNCVSIEAPGVTVEGARQVDPGSDVLFENRCGCEEIDA